jgi:hypothetical protein
LIINVALRSTLARRIGVSVFAVASIVGLGDSSAAAPFVGPLYRRALESKERVLGAEHPDTLTSVNNLAGCLYALGDAAGALPLYRRALESSERVLGAEHPTTQGFRRNLEFVTKAAKPRRRRLVGPKR